MTGAPRQMLGISGTSSGVFDFDQFKYNWGSGGAGALNDDNDEAGGEGAGGGHDKLLFYDTGGAKEYHGRKT